ncbi:alpha/beta hydrolase [Streptosporangium subroseum]|uniref:alpha/beta fold hydrolase n=1 Tax=Streptosporangium subroseum TaxID=106412 RepID=UPI00342DA353
MREERFLQIGGIEQWVTIRGQNTANPLLLIIHGGPGSPYTPFNSWLGTWEAEFTVVQWDQRGSGRSFIRSGETAPADLSLQRLVEDGLELAQHLRERFQQPLVLMGSSVGSLIGAIMAKRQPELFAAYMAANVFTSESASESYRLTLERAEHRGDRRTVSELTLIGSDTAAWTPQQAEEVSKHAIKASVGVPDMVYDLMLPALMYAPDLSMADIRAIDRGMKSTLKALQPEYSRFDFEALGYDYALPYIIVQGASDIVSPVTAARRHFKRITAPSKRIVEVAGAGHLVEFADRARFLAELQLVHETTPGRPMS